VSRPRTYPPKPDTPAPHGQKEPPVALIAVCIALAAAVLAGIALLTALAARNHAAAGRHRPRNFYTDEDLTHRQDDV
jgi:hypothetical protein